MSWIPAFAGMTSKSLVSFLLLVLAIPVHALELPLLFSDGAVLQRDRPLSVWGRAAPGAKLEVALDGRTVATTATSDGVWRVELPAHAAGGPYTLTVREDGGETVTVRDVLVGDVWLASGQSNMEWPVSEAQDAEQTIAQASDTGIRHFKVPKAWSETPQTRLPGGAWKAASPQTVGEFSAVAYAFARELRKRDPRVPIGIVDSTWSGSRIEAWMSADALGLDANALANRLRTLREQDARLQAQLQQRLQRWPQPADDSGWQAPDLDDSDWDALPVPALWESAGYPGMDGTAWYRTRFELTPQEAAAGIVLRLGAIDDGDETWVNGVRVGGMASAWNVAREYRVPPQALRARSNHLAVRVIDNGGGGGLHTTAPTLQVQGGAQRPLPATWRFRPAKVSVNLQDDKNQIDTLLYNAMIHPLQPYPLRGVIWYQGEANANNIADAQRYRDQFATLIRSWREAWAQPRLPFLWAQLASFGSGVDRLAPDGSVLESPWASLRESQSATLALPATGQAVTIDIGDAHDIHPRNKQDVGHRLALAARHVAYGDSLVYSGPVYRDARFEGGRVRIGFELLGSALAVRGGGSSVHGFEVAGADGRFHPAQASIDGDSVVVSSDAVPQPRAVRYAWRDNPEQADLVNREGLPASPFRAEAR